MSKGRRRWMSQLKQRKQIQPFSAFLFYLSPQWIRGCLATLLRVIFFIYSIDSYINLFQKHPYRHTQKKVFSTIWSSFSPVKLTQKINHYNLKVLQSERSLKIRKLRTDSRVRNTLFYSPLFCTENGYSEKWLIPGLEKHKISLKHFIVPESKEVLKKWCGVISESHWD